ncbi:hypothetical protein GCM10017673_53030 [Streptosporangium violaceochromogenes]|nr:hypothetical protein GCM10017673_53030 [Streptosporangium violaceochromogenes]
MVEVMREPRWGTRRPAAAATVVGLVLVVVMAAVTPSSWLSGGWGPSVSNTGLWAPPAVDTHHSTAPRLLTGGAEHLPAPGQLRSLPVAGAVAASLIPLSPAWRSTGPAAVPRRDVGHIVTSRSPPDARLP